LIEEDNSTISISRQCEILGVARSTFYYKPVEKDDSDIKLMEIIDEIYTQYPFYGRRRITAYLCKVKGIKINIKKVDRLMNLMGLQAIYPKKNLSIPNLAHKKYPYLLSGVDITEVNQVWSTDITYIRLGKGFVYLCAVIDWHSRYILSWKLSNTMDTGFCLEALEEALKHGKPKIFNTDQGSQFTSAEFTNRLLLDGIQISMDGRGRALDNIFVERFWRSLKYENVYPNSYETFADAKTGISEYFRFYNNDRLHQSLDYNTPTSVHWNQITLPGGLHEDSIGLKEMRSSEVCSHAVH
jgi:putative transposase